MYCDIPKWNYDLNITNIDSLITVCRTGSADRSCCRATVSSRWWNDGEWFRQRFLTSGHLRLIVLITDINHNLLFVRTKEYAALKLYLLTKIGSANFTKVQCLISAHRKQMNMLHVMSSLPRCSISLYDQPTKHV